MGRSPQKNPNLTGRAGTQCWTRSHCIVSDDEQVKVKLETFASFIWV